MKALLPLGAFKYDRGMSQDKNMISDEAVEAAARVVLQYIDLQLIEHDRERKIPNEAAREILEAAAPYMLGEAWKEGEAAGQDNAYAYQIGIAVKSNPYRTNP